MGAADETEYLDFLLARKAKSLGQSYGVRIRPSELHKVRESETLKSKGPYPLFFHPDPEAKIDLAEVVDRFPNFGQFDIDERMWNVSAIVQAKQLSILGVGQVPPDEVPLDISTISKLSFFGFNCPVSHINLVNETVTQLSFGDAKTALGDLSILSGVPSLKELTINSVKCASLSGLRLLPKLDRLTLYNLRKLTSLADLMEAPQLRDLEIENCGRELDLSPVFELHSLEGLLLKNTQDLERLDSVAAMPKLKVFLMYGNTVKDGNTQVLKQSKTLETFDFDNRRHYNMKRPPLPNFE